MDRLTFVSAVFFSLLIAINGGMATDSVVVDYALDGDGLYNDGMDVVSWANFMAQADYLLDPII